MHGAYQGRRRLRPPEAAEGGVGREGHRVDPIADIETARRPAGVAAITSRTQHPARWWAARQVVVAPLFNCQLSDRHAVLVSVRGSRSAVRAGEPLSPTVIGRAVDLADQLSLFRRPQRGTNPISRTNQALDRVECLEPVAGVEDDGLGVRVEPPVASSLRSTATVTPPAVSAKTPLVRASSRMPVADLVVGDVGDRAAGAPDRLQRVRAVRRVADGQRLGDAGRLHRR